MKGLNDLGRSQEKIGQSSTLHAYLNWFAVILFRYCSGRLLKIYLNIQRVWKRCRIESWIEENWGIQIRRKRKSAVIRLSPDHIILTQRSGEGKIKRKREYSLQYALSLVSHRSEIAWQNERDSRKRERNSPQYELSLAVSRPVRNRVTERF